jgi:transposase-like protein
MRQHFPFRYFEMTTCFPSNISRLHLQIIPMAVIYHMRYPLSFRQVEDIFHERGIDIFHETVRCLDGHLWSSISE